MDREAVKQRITDLVSDFKANYHQHKKELEANTETKLVEPLFAILGWTTKDFVKREQARRGTGLGLVDYAFKIDDKVVFFLEVKKLGVELAKEADTQVISYALSRRIPFAVSTNFENLKIFCVEQENAVNNVFRVFKRPEDYIDNLQDLLFLHKESFEQNLLLKKAEDEGRLKKRISIDRPLLEDLMSIRNMIANDIERRYPGKYDLNEREEIIQRTIDRLIFVRKCEDVGINPDEMTLEEITHNPYGKAHSKLKEIFKRYNDIYNGGLFAVGFDNDCDKITIDGEIVQKLVHLLYESKDKQYVYNFDWIDADILGQVYEQYLGKILAQTKSGKSKLKNGQAHRKEQGIFYTPTYIVDYIVSNTLGNLLREKRIDTKRIKVLDPACGSGSFLIKAFDYLKADLHSNDESKMRRIDEQGMYSIKTMILKKNLYGVDLDAKAVEITKLNLLLKAAEKFRKLPEDMELHVKQGNSLIDDKSIAGLNAFRWIGDFQDGSFDVVIGNPPYVESRDIEDENWKHYRQKYSSAHKRFDLSVLFIEKAIDVLRNNGLLGMIISNKFSVSDYGYGVRKFILDNCRIQQIVDVSNIDVFKDASTYPYIMILQKEQNKIKRDSNVIKVKRVFADTELKSMEEFSKIKQASFLESPNYIFSIDSTAKISRILDVIKSESVPLGEICEMKDGIHTGNIRDKLILDHKENDDCKRLITAESIDRYSIKWNGLWVDYRRELIDTKKKEYGSLRNPRIFEASEKLLTALFGLRPEVAYDDGRLYANNSVKIVLARDKDMNLKWILAILNSNLMAFYYRILFAPTHVRGGYIQFYPKDFLRLPIKKIKQEKRNDLTKLVDEILSLNIHLSNFGDKKTSDTAKIEEEIKKTDAKIDELVYELYGLTGEEIRIVENSLASLHHH